MSNEAFEKWFEENIYRRFVFNADKEELLELWQAAKADSEREIAELEKIRGQLGQETINLHCEVAVLTKTNEQLQAHINV